MKRFSAKRTWVKVSRALRLNELSPFMRRLVVGVIGGTVLLVGIALLVLPGPAFIVIPVGLAILATEFAWARRSVRKAGDIFNSARQSFSSKKPQPQE